MSIAIPNFTPYVPSDASLISSTLPDKALRLSTIAAQLAGQTSAITRNKIIDHMAIVNSYYSNLIEGNNTLPHEIRAAQAGDYSADVTKRDHQLESIAHIHVQNWLKNAAPTLDVLYRPEFILAIHREFFKHVPERLHQIKDSDDKVVERIAPGKWREHEISIGYHIGPNYHSVPELVEKFCDIYHPKKYYGDRKVIAIMSAHHRLSWIHPFSDGNGRVMRLFTDAGLRAIGMASNGVWCLSRGLARSTSKYKSALSQADSVRQGDYDGRGVLSERTLIAFCEFMLDTAIDQVEYMSTLLTLEGMHQRMKSYVQARNDGRVLGFEPLKENAINVLYNAFISGKLSRSFAIESCGMPARSARRLLAQMKEDGILSETSSRSDIYWEIPSHVESWYFPQLSPGV